MRYPLAILCPDQRFTAHLNGWATAMAEHWNSLENVRIRTWEGIAAYLDEAPSEIEIRAKEQALPVHYLPKGSPDRVFAYTADLDRWRGHRRADAGRQGSLVDAAGGAHPAPVGSGRKADQDKQAQTWETDGGKAVAHGAEDLRGPVAATPVPSPRERSGTRSFLAGAAAIFAAVVGLALFHTTANVSRMELSASQWERASALKMASLRPMVAAMHLVRKRSGSAPEAGPRPARPSA